MFPEEEVIRRIVEGETELFALLADRYAGRSTPWSTGSSATPKMPKR